MAATHKPFRELVRPDSRFEFVGKARFWAFVSVLLIAGSIAMLFVNKQVRGDYLNWTIDFKGGTEMIFGFTEEANPDKHVDVQISDVRKALSEFGSVDVSEFTWSDTEEGRSVTVRGVVVRTPQFGALSAEESEKVATAFQERFGDKQLESLQWSGDRLFVRSLQFIPHEQAAAFFKEHGLDLKDWDGEQQARFTTPEQGTGEYNIQFSVWGLDRQFVSALDEAMPGVDVEVVQSYGVGAKAGEQLRNDGIKSLFYAMALIMLYLAFRFDVRYAPGAVVALLHDAVLVVGIFALTWQEVSLTTVAALLTVIGYSVNDTVVIFDRIRENVPKYKDKKLPRIVNISLNETLARTLLTSITLFVVTLMMNIFGTGLVRNFAFAMNIGVIGGVYSTLFVASPIMLYIHNKYYGPNSKVRGGAAASTPTP